MSFIPVLDRNALGMFLVACEDCGKGLDWLSGYEVAMIAMSGYRHFCFECDSLEADLVPRCFTDMHNNPLDIELWYANGGVSKIPARPPVAGGGALVLLPLNSNKAKREKPV